MTKNGFDITYYCFVLCTICISFPRSTAGLVHVKVDTVAPLNHHAQSHPPDGAAEGDRGDAAPTFFNAHEFRRRRSFHIKSGAVNCSSTSNPCAPGGACVTDACVCYQDTTNGFWTGSTCSSCMAGYAGPSCNNPCPGSLCNPCSGHGTCDEGVSGSGTCTCFATITTGFWSGTDCSVCAPTYYGQSCTESCPGATSNEGSCYGRGTCYSDAAGNSYCTCDPGYDAASGCEFCDFAHYGPSCSYTCPGYNGVVVCSGHGTCFNGTTANGSCVCDVAEGYGTADCSQQCPELCNEPSGFCNAGASGSGQCTCQPNYVLPACATCIANKTGTDCAYDCPINSTTGYVCNNNGLCSFNATSSTVYCLCAPGFYGTYCELQCPGNPPCSGHGTCVNGQCVCFADAVNGYWAGANCSNCTLAYNQSRGCTLRCPTANGQICNGYGTCYEGVCYCIRNDPQTGYDYCGIACETFSTPNDYNAQGQCQGCTCVYCPSDYYLGAACNIPCDGVENLLSGTVACNQHGYCRQGMSFSDPTCGCVDGWTGPACNVQCPTDADGLICGGPSRGYCNYTTDVFGAISVFCECYPAFAGPNCEINCPQIAGSICSGNGQCNNTYLGDGTCICNTGYTGVSCGVVCACDSNHGSCDSVACRDYPTYATCYVCDCNGNFTGLCDSCVPGYQGTTCTGICLNGNTSGTACQCDEYWSGAGCDIPCPRNETGALCSGNGYCAWGNTFGGDCVCSPTWFGTYCNVSCTPQACSQPPYSLVNPQCDAVTGACECLSSYAGGYWAGSTCNECQVGFYGQNCLEVCDCNGNGGCDQSTGECSCFANSVDGYYAGTTCSTCATGYIGENCQILNIAITQVNGNATFGYVAPPIDALTVAGGTAFLPRETNLFVDQRLRILWVGSLPLLKIDLLSGYPVLMNQTFVANRTTAVNSTLNCEPEVAYTWVHQQYIFFLMQPSVVCQQDVRIVRMLREDQSLLRLDSPTNYIVANGVIVWNWTAMNRTVRIHSAQGIGSPYLLGELGPEDNTPPLVVMLLVQYSGPGGTGTRYSGGIVLRVDVDLAEVLLYSSQIQLCEPVERSMILSTNFVPSSLALQAPNSWYTLGNPGCPMLGYPSEYIAIGGSLAGAADILVFMRNYSQGATGWMQISPTPSGSYSMSSLVACWPPATQASSSAAGTSCAECVGVSALSWSNFSIVANIFLQQSGLPVSYMTLLQPFNQVAAGQEFYAQFDGSTVCALSTFSPSTTLVTAVSNPSLTTYTLPLWIVTVTPFGTAGATATSLVIDSSANVAYGCFVFTTGSSESILAKFNLSATGFTIYGTLSLGFLSLPQSKIPVSAQYDVMYADSTGRILYGLQTGFYQLVINRFLLTEVTSVSPNIADDRGGTIIALQGSGFATQTNFVTGYTFPITCLFGSSTVVNASNVTFYTAFCVMVPADNTSASISCDGDSVELSNYGMLSSGAYMTQNAVSVLGYTTPVLLGAPSPDRAPQTGGITITLSGTGFVQSSYALCSFYSTNPLSSEPSEMTPATFVSPSMVTCPAPQFASVLLSPSWVDLAEDGQIFTGTPLSFNVVGNPANISSTTLVSAVASPITEFNVTVYVVDNEGHKLGVFDTTNQTVCLSNATDTELPCSSSNFGWRTPTDGFPWPPCRNLTLFLPTDTETWCQNMTDGAAVFAGLYFVTPRATTVTVKFTGVGAYAAWFSLSQLAITEGTGVALEIFNYADLVGRRFDKGHPLSPTPELVVVDALGNILPNPGTSITITAHTFYILDSDLTNVIDTAQYTAVYQQSSLITFAQIILSYVNAASHYILFVSSGTPTPYRNVTSPPLRTALCANPSLNYKIANTSQCAPCPSVGATCNGSSSIVVLPGYWRGDTVSDIYLCPGGGVCLGSPQGFAGAACAPGYEGVLCSICSPGYGRSGANSCGQCPSLNAAFGYVVSAALGAILVLLGWSTATLRQAEIYDATIIMRTVVNHVQTAGKLGEFSVQWSPFLQSLFAVQSSGSSMSFSGLASFDCILRAYGQDYAAIFYVYMALPLVAVVMALAVYLVVTLAKMKPVLSKRLEKEVKDDIAVFGTHTPLSVLLRRYPFYFVLVTVLCVTMFTLYQTLITQSTSVLSCTGYVVAPGVTQYYLDVDRTITCEANGNNKLRTPGLFFVAAYGGGIPFIFILGYLFVKGRIHKPGLTHQMFMFLIGGYKEQFWWWQAIIMVRKMLIVLIVVYIPSEPQLQSYAGMWTLTAALAGQLWFQPNDKKEFNDVELMSLSVITITLNLGLLYFWNGMTSFGQNILTAVLIAISLGVFVMFGYYLYEPIKVILLEVYVDLKELIDGTLLPAWRSFRNKDSNKREEAVKKSASRTAVDSLWKDGDEDDVDLEILGATSMTSSTTPGKRKDFLPPLPVAQHHHTAMNFEQVAIANQQGEPHKWKRDSDPMPRHSSRPNRTDATFPSEWL